MRFFFALERLYYPIKKINWFNFIKYYNSESKNIVILHYNFFNKFRSELFAWELGYINFFIKNKITFKISFINGRIQNSNIFWSPDKYFDSFKFINYPNTLSFIASQFESQNNSIYPSSHDIKFLENKLFMYSEFEKFKIPIPKTYIFSAYSEVNYNKLKFPILYKGIHSSGGKDIILLKSIRDAKKKLSFLNKNEPVVFQKLVNMRKDMRVTLINHKIIYSFWRINNSKDWKITSTKNGSSVLFEDLPLIHQNKIIEYSKALNIRSAGFDITFENDDLNSKMLILEVSPRFSQNPKSPKDFLLPYKNFKKKLMLKNSFRNLQTSAHFNLAYLYLESIFKKK